MENFKSSELYIKEISKIFETQPTMASINVDVDDFYFPVQDIFWVKEVISRFKKIALFPIDNSKDTYAPRFLKAFSELLEVNPVDWDPINMSADQMFFLTEDCSWRNTLEGLFFKIHQKLSTKNFISDDYKNFTKTNLETLKLEKATNAAIKDPASLLALAQAEIAMPYTEYFGKDKTYVPILPKAISYNEEDIKFIYSSHPWHTRVMGIISQFASVDWTDAQGIVDGIMMACNVTTSLVRSFSDLVLQEGYEDYATKFTKDGYLTTEDLRDFYSNYLDFSSSELNDVLQNIAEAQSFSDVYLKLKNEYKDKYTEHFMIYFKEKLNQQIANIMPLFDDTKWDGTFLTSRPGLTAIDLATNTIADLTLNSHGNVILSNNQMPQNYVVLKNLTSDIISQMHLFNASKFDLGSTSFKKVVEEQEDITTDFLNPSKTAPVFSGMAINNTSLDEYQRVFQADYNREEVYNFKKALNSLLIDSYLNGQLLDNCFDVILEEVENNTPEDFLSFNKLFSLRASNVFIPGRKLTTFESKYKTGLTITKPDGRMETQTMHNFSILLDSKMQMYRKIQDLSGFKAYETSDIKNFNVFDNIYVNSNKKYNILVVMYDHLDQNTVMKKDNAIALYCFEHVKFLGIGSELNYKAVGGGSTTTFNMPFVCRRSYFIDIPNQADDVSPYIAFTPTQNILV